MQALKVTPAQSTLEVPYITRNIDATRAALGLDSVEEHSFAGVSNLTGGVVAGASATLDNLPLWEPSITSQTYQKLQQNGTGFTIAGLSLDRYRIGGSLTPFVIGVREVNAGDLPTQSWVNTHLQYTHGFGAILSPANQQNGGNPVFDISGVPPQSSAGAPKLSQTGSAVYFGLGETGYVVADTSQKEVDFSDANGNITSSHYTGSGGIPVGSFWTKAAFALRFHDLNLLISSDVGSKSRLMFNQDVRVRVAKVAPFLTVDDNPYPVIDKGQIDWIVDAYTTTSYYPYAQQAATSELPGGSGLVNASFNYVRNSVKVVVNAYTGNMTFYATTKNEPILNTWESIFPGMFKPLSAMDDVLRAHLRYPEAMLMVQSQMFGRYHLTNPSSFYIANNAWELAPTSGTGSPDSPLPTDAYGNTLRFVPEYEILQLPGASQTGFTAIEPLDPLSQGDRIQTLAALMTASCSYSHYGELSAYETPTRSATAGPAVVNSRIQSNTTVSQYVTLLGRAGSTVTLGTTLIIPIDDSLIYVRPLYVSSSQNAYPQLTRYIVVYGNQVQMGTSLGAALSGVFGAITSQHRGRQRRDPGYGQSPYRQCPELLQPGRRGTQDRGPEHVLGGHEDRRQPHRSGREGTEEVHQVCRGESIAGRDEARRGDERACLVDGLGPGQLLGLPPGLNPSGPLPLGLLVCEECRRRVADGADWLAPGNLVDEPVANRLGRVEVEPGAKVIRHLVLTSPCRGCDPLVQESDAPGVMLQQSS